MSPQRRVVNRSGQRGIALVAVLLFLLLAGSAAATFVYRSLTDVLIAGNRDAGAQAEALASGGVEVAFAILAQDRLDESSADFRAEAWGDDWHRLASVPISTEDGALLRIRVEDAGSRLNLNALFADGLIRDPLTEILLIRWFERLADEAPDVFRSRDPDELAQNLIDWVDADETRPGGGLEDDYYQRQRPSYRAANRPLLSVDELALIEGFDAEVVAVLRPYVTVYPLAGGDGINPNTAPPWVLALLFHGTGDDFLFAEEETVRAILDIREGGGILCADDADHPSCTPIREAIPGEIFPPPTFSTDVFRVVSQAEVGDVIATVEATVDREDPIEPTLLSWRVD